LRRIPVEKPAAPLTADPGLATAAPEQLQMTEVGCQNPEAEPMSANPPS
jgi:hypothetical protein